MRRPCDHCGGDFEARNGTARFCTDRCRKAARRKADLTPPRPVLVPSLPADQRDGNPESGPMARLAHAHLVALGQDGDVLAGLALVLARAIDNGPHTGAALSALTREFSRVWTQVQRNATPVEENPLQRMRRLRAERQAADRASTDH